MIPRMRKVYHLLNIFHRKKRKKIKFITITTCIRFSSYFINKIPSDILKPCDFSETRSVIHYTHAFDLSSVHVDVCYADGRQGTYRALLVHLPSPGTLGTGIPLILTTHFVCLTYLIKVITSLEPVHKRLHFYS